MPNSLSKVGAIQLSWVRNGERRAAIAYSHDASEVHYLITDYSIYLSDTQLLGATTVENEIFHVKAFIEYLNKIRINLIDVTDAVLKDFRESEFKNVKKSSNASKSIKAAQRTVNAKLRRAYLFLLWAQTIEGACHQIMGPTGSPVTSTLPTSVQSTKQFQRYRTKYLRECEYYPMLFANTGQKSRHGTQYEATEQDIEQLSNYFYANCSIYAAQRNILMMELATHISWRRGSVNSLTCDQFANVTSEEIDDDQIVVVPPSQKFGYERAFDVPFRLAFRVAEFIVTARRDMMNSNGWRETKTQDRIFLSEREGTPLRNSTISTIFGRAFQTLGRPRGANFHSFRRKFANDLIEKEIHYRLEIGLDTSALSIATAVSLRMGQSSPESLMPYISSQLGRMASRQEQSKVCRLRDLEEENMALREQIAKLQG